MTTIIFTKPHGLGFRVENPEEKLQESGGFSGYAFYGQ